MQYPHGIRNARIVSIHPGIARRNANELTIEVRVCDDRDLGRTYEALEWLLARGYKDEVDWDIDMRRGLTGYSSFFFKDQDLATEFKLVMA